MARALRHDVNGDFQNSTFRAGRRSAFLELFAANRKALALIAHKENTNYINGIQGQRGPAGS
jgi:hypothetical protein